MMAKEEINEIKKMNFITPSASRKSALTSFQTGDLARKMCTFA
jgi:hypothetical protein